MFRVTPVGWCARSYNTVGPVLAVADKFSVILERLDGYSTHDLARAAMDEPRGAHFYYSYAYVNRITSTVKYS